MGGNDERDDADVVGLDDHTADLRDVDSVRAYLSVKFRELRRIRMERARFQAETAAEVERLEAECDALTAPMEKRITELLHEIENGAIALRALDADEAKREWMVPYGTIGLTVRQPSVILGPEGSKALLPWAKVTAPQIVTSEVVEKVDTAAAKRLVQIAGEVVVDGSGEVVEGFRVKPRSETWDVAPMGCDS